MSTYDSPPVADAIGYRYCNRYTFDVTIGDTSKKKATTANDRHASSTSLLLLHQLFRQNPKLRWFR